MKSKLLILMLFLFFMLVSRGQDVTKKQLDSLKTEIIEMKSNQTGFYYQYKSGVNTIILGTAISIVGSFALSKSSPQGVIGVNAVGGLINLFGIIKVVNAHKYFRYYYKGTTEKYIYY